MRFLLPMLFLVACRMPHKDLTPPPWPMAGVGVWRTMQRPSGLAAELSNQWHALSDHRRAVHALRRLQVQQEWRAAY